MCVFIRKTADVEIRNEYKKLEKQRNCFVANLLLIAAGALRVFAHSM